MSGHADGSTLSAALGRAARWRLLSLLLERPRPAWGGQVRALALEVDDAALVAAARRAEAADERGYLRLLGPGGLVSPREVAYRPLADPGALLARLHTLHRAFAFVPGAEEPADHAAVESAFVAYLYLKEAFATAQADAPRVASVRRAIALVREEHLAGFAAAFAERLAHADAGYLAAAARCLADRVPGSLPVAATTPADEHGCLACGHDAVAGRCPTPTE